MRLKRPLAALCLVLCLPLISGGCNPQPAGITTDPFVQSTSAAITTGESAVKAFLRVDDDNRAFVARELPQVHAWAEALRQRDPATGEAVLTRYRREAVQALQLYAASRSNADLATLNGKLQALQQLADQARNFTGAVTARQLGAATRPA